MLVVAALFPPAHAPAEVARLIRQIRTTYSTCKTYRDSGTQTIWRIDKKGSRTVWGEWKFSTIFARPKHLRLEISERAGPNKWLTSVLWTVPGSKATSTPKREIGRLYIGLDGSQEPVTDLESGLVALSSLSFGIATQVPSLLLPSPSSSTVLDLYKWKLGKGERVKEKECSVLISNDSLVKLWIDKKTFLIRQVQDTTDLGDGPSSVRVVQFAPEINVKVLDSEFVGPKSL